MSRSAYSYIAEAWRKLESGGMRELMRGRYIEWRRGPTVARVERPTRLDRARAIGYEAKQGFVVVRVRVKKGGLSKERPNSGRRPKRMGVYGYAPGKPQQLIAEEKAARKFRNMEVLGSYWVGDDGINEYFEIVLVDPHHPAVASDPDMNWITSPSQRGRAFRGKTMAGRRMRGLLGNRGVRGTHRWKWGRKANERRLRKRHEASRGARLIVTQDKAKELGIAK